MFSKLQIATDLFDEATNAKTCDKLTMFVIDKYSALEKEKTTNFRALLNDLQSSVFKSKKLLCSVLTSESNHQSIFNAQTELASAVRSSCGNCLFPADISNSLRKSPFILALIFDQTSIKSITKESLETLVRQESEKNGLEINLIECSIYLIVVGIKDGIDTNNVITETKFKIPEAKVFVFFRDDDTGKVNFEEMICDVEKDYLKHIKTQTQKIKGKLEKIDAISNGENIKNDKNHEKIPNNTMTSSDQKIDLTRRKKLFLLFKLALLHETDSNPKSSKQTWESVYREALDYSYLMTEIEALEVREIAAFSFFKIIITNQKTAGFDIAGMMRDFDRHIEEFNITRHHCSLSFAFSAWLSSQWNLIACIVEQNKNGQEIMTQGGNLYLIHPGILFMNSIKHAFKSFKKAKKYFENKEIRDSNTKNINLLKELLKELQMFHPDKMEENLSNIMSYLLDKAHKASSDNNALSNIINDMVNFYFAHYHIKTNNFDFSIPLLQELLEKSKKNKRVSLACRIEKNLLCSLLSSDRLSPESIHGLMLFLSDRKTEKRDKVKLTERFIDVVDRLKENVSYDISPLDLLKLRSLEFEPKSVFWGQKTLVKVIIESNFEIDLDFLKIEILFSDESYNTVLLNDSVKNEKTDLDTQQTFIKVKSKLSKTNAFCFSLLAKPESQTLRLQEIKICFGQLANPLVLSWIPKNIDHSIADKLRISQSKCVFKPEKSILSSFVKKETSVRLKNIFNESDTYNDLILEIYYPETIHINRILDGRSVTIDHSDVNQLNKEKELSKSCLKCASICLSKTRNDISNLDVFLCSSQAGNHQIKIETKIEDNSMCESTHIIGKDQFELKAINPWKVTAEQFLKPLIKNGKLQSIHLYLEIKIQNVSDKDLVVGESYLHLNKLQLHENCNETFLSQHLNETVHPNFFLLETVVCVCDKNNEEEQIGEINLSYKQCGEVEFHKSTEVLRFVKYNEPSQNIFFTFDYPKIVEVEKAFGLQIKIWNESDKDKEISVNLEKSESNSFSIIGILNGSVMLAPKKETILDFSLIAIHTGALTLPKIELGLKSPPVLLQRRDKMLIYSTSSYKDFKF